MSNKQDDDEKYEKSSAFDFMQLEDFIYMNMKRQRHIHFLEMQSLNTVIRDVEGYNGEIGRKQMKLVSVRPFSYAIWKLMEDMSSEKNITVAELSKE